MPGTAVDERAPPAVHVHAFGVLELGDVGAHRAEECAGEGHGEDVPGLEHLEAAQAGGARRAAPAPARGAQRRPHHRHFPPVGVDGPQAPARGVLVRRQDLLRGVHGRRRHAIGLQRLLASCLVIEPVTLGEPGVDALGVLGRCDDGGGVGLGPRRVAEGAHQALPLVVLHGRDADHPVRARVEAGGRAVPLGAGVARAVEESVDHAEDGPGRQRRLLRRHLDVYRAVRAGEVQAVAGGEGRDLAGREEGLAPGELQRLTRRGR